MAFLSQYNSVENIDEILIFTRLSDNFSENEVMFMN